jgi:hypothetical protein
MDTRGILRALTFSLVLAAAVVAGAALPAGAASPWSMGAVAGQEPVMRDCTSSVYGDLGSDWMRSSIVVGPLAFVRARAYSSSTSSFASVGGGRYRGSKLLAAVRTGWVVRVVVPAADRRKVALQYAPADFNRAVVPAQSEHDVIFTACPPGRPFLGPTSAPWTQFNGAIVVAGRRCVMLSVFAAKQGHPLPRRPRLARLSFGAGACRG